MTRLNSTYSHPSAQIQFHLYREGWFFLEINIKTRATRYTWQRWPNHTPDSKHSTVTHNVNLHAQNNTTPAAGSLILRRTRLRAFNTEGRFRRGKCPEWTLSPGNSNSWASESVGLRRTGMRTFIHTECRRCQCSNIGGIDASARKLGLTIGLHAAWKLLFAPLIIFQQLSFSAVVIIIRSCIFGDKELMLSYQKSLRWTALVDSARTTDVLSTFRLTQTAQFHSFFVRLRRRPLTSPD